jgi:CHAT domain-containing protein/tetratricopeptide (TPR) repeat protein
MSGTMRVRSSVALRSVPAAVVAFVACLQLMLVAPAAAASQPPAAPEPASPHPPVVDQRLKEADTRLRKGIFLYDHQQYSGARTELLAAMRSFEALDRRGGVCAALVYLGWTAFASETNDIADAYWTRGLEIARVDGDRAMEARFLHNRAFVVASGPEKDALLENALRLARAVGDLNMESGSLYKMGQELSAKGRYVAAIEVLHQARRGFERAGIHQSVARVLLELAQLHLAHDDFEQALTLSRRAAGIMQRLVHKEGVAHAIASMADVHRAAGRLSQALALQQRALAVIAATGGVRVINVERQRLAEVFLELGDYARAKTLLDEIMDGPDKRTRNLAYFPLAEALFGLQRYDEAREMADRAIQATPESALRPFMLAQRARAEDKLGRTTSALADLDEALHLLEARRGQLVPSDHMKRGYGERVQHLFAFAVDLHSRLGRHGAALEAAEQSRARAFLDLLATRQRAAARAEARAAASSPSARPDGAGWLASATAAAPVSILQLAEVARRLDSVIVSYWVTPTVTRIWVIDGEGRVNAASSRVSAGRLTSLIGQTMVDPDAVTLRGVPGGAPASAHAQGGPERIASDASPREAWRELYDLLIRPVRPFLPERAGSLVTIVPHGPLFRLSFAALIEERGTYLLERYRLHYVPSGGSLLYLRRQRPADRPARYLLVGNPDGPTTAAPLAPLPGAAREVAAIARALPPSTTTVLTGRDATEARVRGDLAGQTVIHLATHGVLRDDRPFESFLALAGRGSDPTRDGRLTSADIYELTLDADLVVLSACRSGRGPVTGDGVLGMTRAFAYAGAPSVIATQWDLADEAAAELMPVFYRQWRHGTGASGALRDAQLDLLARLRAGRVTVAAGGRVRAVSEHPLLWAGFVLVGEP